MGQPLHTIGLQPGKAAAVATAGAIGIAGQWTLQSTGVLVCSAHSAKLATFLVNPTTVLFWLTISSLTLTLELLHKK